MKGEGHRFQSIRPFLLTSRAKYPGISENLDFSGRVLGSDTPNLPSTDINSWNYHRVRIFPSRFAKVKQDIYKNFSFVFVPLVFP